MLSAWTIVSLYNIAGADAKEDFSFVDENNDNEMSWGEVSQESYDIDPDDNDSFAKEIEENSDSFRVIFPIFFYNWCHNSMLCIDVLSTTVDRSYVRDLVIFVLTETDEQIYELK